MAPLPTDLRRLLEKKVVEARDAAEAAAAGALTALAVDRPEPFAAMSDADRDLRRILRARARQLGEFREPLAESMGFALLVQETAYEHWHRMLFARFLAENDLLIHPEHGIPVTLQECAELTSGEGEPDEWMLAARYASGMLPGIFRTQDPVLKIRFAPEGRQALEAILAELPSALFLADDSLGWVYQFWQTKKKAEVNKSERKIGGADLSAVTQLFTEHYMVAFLLENSLGAWWAGKHPESPLLKEWEYLRCADDGTAAAGAFEGWPKIVAEVTVMDPCCGSGHFLVTAFDMLRKMREEEEGLSSQTAADAVLRDNLFGLELDGRCVQIAVFALALSAWKVGGYHELPTMNLACCGVPARGTAQEWRELGGTDSRLADALERLYYLFKDADTLGSLIDPRRAAESDRLTGVAYEEVAPLLHEALSRYGGDDPAQQVFAQAAEDVATAAKLLAGRYTLVVTNPPYLGREKQSSELREFFDIQGSDAKHDLSAGLLSRQVGMARTAGSFASVMPQYWLFLSRYRALRRRLLVSSEWRVLVTLGSGAFGSISGEVVNTCLILGSRSTPSSDSHMVWIGADDVPLDRKPSELRAGAMVRLLQADQQNNPDSIIGYVRGSQDRLLEEYCYSYQGLATSDNSQFVVCFWEVSLGHEWHAFQFAPESTTLVSGCTNALYFEDGNGRYYRHAMALKEVGKLGGWQSGRDAWGKAGVAVNRMSNLPCCLYLGTKFDCNVAAIVPNNPCHLPAVLAFCSSDEYAREVRRLNKKLCVTNATLVRVPFDLEYWTKVAEEKCPDGLPKPRSDDPTQWLFRGNIVDSESPLHVAVARLLGHSWPDQEPDELDRYSDSDGIVCIPAVAGERPAADRLLELLAVAYEDAWSQPVLEGLLAGEGSSDLGAWLRDDFFTSHCKLFHHRPFVWHIWDGRKDGFAALVNYHKLDRKLLERLTYSTVQSWIDRQKAEVARGVAGAEGRLAAAIELKQKLELILKGEPPHDIYVRWKPLSQQPIGWDPDINDGVRLNSRPFVTAGVLRAKFNVKWEKDRGKNPDGSERLNDLHHTIAEKLAARGQGGGR